MYFLALVLSLPTENATARQRIWRGLKASGAAVLRDGVYLMPERAACRIALDRLAGEVRSAGGMAHVMRIEEPCDTDFAPLFDRSAECAALLAQLDHARQQLDSTTADGALRHARKLRKAFAALVAIDFFAGEAQRQVESALCDLELACARALAPDEPRASGGTIARLRPEDYHGRIWATRARPWVDRLASAWLIRRFIDPHAQLLWLAAPADCPADALGFDFDGASFSHVDARVTFEVLAASFDLHDASIARLGQLVHFLDVGGAQPPEAAGIESVLAGLRAGLADDDQLLAAASTVFDGLWTRFAQSTP
ncbi:MAG: chromate resistance protein [Pseudomonadota bacterium]|nr:chromate resistance protein [Pseudomonadota bacterium]